MKTILLNRRLCDLLVSVNVPIISSYVFLILNELHFAYVGLQTSAWDFPWVSLDARCILKKCIIMWSETDRRPNASERRYTCSENKRHRCSGKRKWERDLQHEGWHVPMSINSLERLTVRNKALYTSYSDRRRSKGTTRPCMCICVFVCASDKVLLHLLPFLKSPQTQDAHQRLFQNI